MQDNDIHPIMIALRAAVGAWRLSIVDALAQRAETPYKILITTMLSLRTQDTTTGPASERLFALADTPVAMLTLSAEAIEQAIYPVGFYKVGAERAQSVTHPARNLRRTRARDHRRADRTRMRSGSRVPTKIRHEPVPPRPVRRCAAFQPRGCGQAGRRW